MLTELVHQRNCKKNEMVTDVHTGEIACSSCGIVSLEPNVDLLSYNIYYIITLNEKIFNNFYYKLIDYLKRNC